MKFSRTFNILMAMFLVAASMANAQPAAAQRNFQPNGNITRDTLFIPGEVVVGFASGQTAAAYGAQASALAGEVNAQVVDLYGNNALLSFSEDADVEALATQLSGKSGVAYAQPNYIAWIPEENPVGTAHVTKNVIRNTADGQTTTISKAELSAMRTIRGGKLGVPTYPVEGGVDDNWGWWAINASVIWPEKKVSPTVCVIDTGVDIAHPDLKGKVTNGYDFVNGDPIPDDDNGHGTHVTGTIVATTNNKIGFSGISNGKVLAVKVLNAQGWGTSFDIASGIMYCANNTTVKIINMSLGGSIADVSEFSALEYAIAGKGKLVVAAAGNDGTSDYSFPAAWGAEYVCKNGSDTFPATCGDNTINSGLLAVGAARSYGSSSNDGDNFGTVDGSLWVDTSTDFVEDPGELYDAYSCATNFSNYGAWVQIVAPGEDIFSSLPVTYPFYEAYFNDADVDGDGYDWFNGTSMAAPHVSGAAARVLSVQAPTYTNAQLKIFLLSSGKPLVVASDSTMTDATAGYDAGFGGEAPFCWPDATEGNRYDMTGSVYLDVAAAMGRTAVSAAVSEAVTGLPLTGATVSAYQGAALKDTALISSKTYRWVDLINLPEGLPITVKVTKTGYTAGAVSIGDITPSFMYESNEYLNLAIPPIGRITLVANWDDGIDLDLYTFLPIAPGGAVVGAGASGNSKDAGPGELTIPLGVKTRWNRDGGGADPLGIESVTMIPGTGAFKLNPYYNNSLTNTYDFFLTDYGSFELNVTAPVIRLWRGGVTVPSSSLAAPYNAYMLSDVCDSDGADNTTNAALPTDAVNDDNEWLKVGHITGSIFTFDDTCGPTTSIWPYSGVSSTSNASGE